MKNYMSGDFQKKLHKLNPKLHIFAGDNDAMPAGIWHVDKGEYTELCGVPKNWVPEYNEFDAYGKMLKRGWRGILRFLIAKGYADRHRSYKVFGYWQENRQPVPVTEKKALDKAMAEVNERATMKKIENPLQPGQMVEVPVYRTDDVVDVGRMISKEKGHAS